MKNSRILLVSGKGLRDKVVNHKWGKDLINSTVIIILKGQRVIRALWAVGVWVR